MSESVAFAHRQSAHCESGVASSMLSHYGLPISEPMAFGLAAALTFAYIPFVKMAGMPLIAYRMPPGAIIKAMQKRLNVRMVRRTFRDPETGMRALDEQLAQGRIVGLQTCIYWLPYVPDSFRFHFNAHNLIVYGREGDDYLISDPIFETTTRCARDALLKARFAKGDLAAKGLMYYADPQANRVAHIDYGTVIPQAVRANLRIMRKAPLPVIGVKGIRYLARRVMQLHRAPQAQISLYLTHIVRMQEEIGTGGAGFRFIYASFLQEAANLLDSPLLAEASRKMTDAGDEWRRFALHATKMSRGRQPLDLDALSVVLNRCADYEAHVWDLLKAV